MKTYSVSLINSDEVTTNVFNFDADTPNEAIERARSLAQLPYCRAEAYERFGEFDYSEEPVMVKHCHARPGQFSKKV